MNYFEILGLPVQLNLDESALREKYIAASKASHPDLYTLADEAAQLEAEERSSLINEAYRMLKTAEGRAKAVLKLYEAEVEAPLPPDFLMEMMELNELKETNLEKAALEVAQLKAALNASMQLIFEAFDAADEADKRVQALKLGPILSRLKYLERLEA